MVNIKDKTNINENSLETSIIFKDVQGPEEKLVVENCHCKHFCFTFWATEGFPVPKGFQKHVLLLQIILDLEVRLASTGFTTVLPALLQHCAEGWVMEEAWTYNLYKTRCRFGKQREHNDAFTLGYLYT